MALKFSNVARGYIFGLASLGAFIFPLLVFLPFSAKSAMYLFPLLISIGFASMTAGFEMMSANHVPDFAGVVSFVAAALTVLVVAVLASAVTDEELRISENLRLVGLVALVAMAFAVVVHFVGIAALKLVSKQLVFYITLAFVVLVHLVVIDTVYVSVGLGVEMVIDSATPLSTLLGVAKWLFLVKLPVLVSALAMTLYVSAPGAV